MPTAYIGLGANLPSCAGPPEATLVAAAERLERLGHVTRRSSLYSSRPVGFANQPSFVNAVVELETDLDPHALLEELLAIEKEFGRDRSAGIRNGPRTLDLDILLFDRIKIDEPGLEIPHPRLAERPFVLIPLFELSPSIVHAGKNQTMAQLLHDVEVVQDAGPSAESETAARAVVPIRWPDWHSSAWCAAGGPPAGLKSRAPESDPDRRG